MTAIPPFLSLVDMYGYLPNFDADCDLQVGDWVVVQPQRRAALLGPLISAWETAPQDHALSAASSFVPQYTLSQLLPEPLTLRRRSLAWNRVGLDSFSTRLPRLAPLSMARAHYCQRKRLHVSDDSPTNTRESSVCEDDASSGNGNLYLHVRLGLLTPSRPYVFGGLDIVEVLGWPYDDACAEDTAAPVPPRSATQKPAVLYLNLLTGETLTREEAVRRTSKLMPSFTSSTTTWSSAIEEAAEKEWQQWVLRGTCITQQQPCR
ncbi:conserved hypothetical protein [Leishmania major strain Friedlin]|uniref:Uncharacterized protein n=1 Tax=Leishmania major TaxID=5664 RepID=Q4Q9U8_LEIMA|nr:conserved hypothetical protein [Leishmania major strain Friedlin]CAG9575162.1 hypothetical_protein_-_conserved [Leishmania major strain Friedlin]CAJ05281.1 conserved hypothetical protein [Leishmania major strain Friedlin]|eukprot:XP_001683900.1 conserved hypothetical protein [Leishmania major strain Friedlin]